MLKILLASFISLLVISIANSEVIEESAFLHESDVAWETNEFPIHRWKTLIGNGVKDRLNPEDVYAGTWELAPKATYHGHKHEIPEIYFIISGKALWTVGDETQEVTAGTSIYTKPGAVHKMTNLLDTPLQAIWLWWAPGGNQKIFESEYLFTEEPPEQPEGARFD